MRQPAAVVRIGLVSAPILHVRSVGKDHADVRLKQVEDRLPVAPRALHHGIGATLRNQPGGKPVEFSDDRAELLDLRPWFVLGAGRTKQLSNIRRSSCSTPPALFKGTS